MSLEGAEGWLAFGTNENELEIPKERAEIDKKSQSERLRNVLYVLYMQETKKGKNLGLFETFKDESYEKFITYIKGKLDD